MRSFALTVTVLGSMVMMLVAESPPEPPTPECHTFDDIRDQSNPFKFRCDQGCMNKSRPFSGDVFGTLLYYKNSDVCLSGLHAGALNMSGGSINIHRESFSDRKRILATCRNRICSKHTYEKDLFSVSETEKIIYGKVGGDVMLIHDSYNNKRLKVLCLSEDDNTQYPKEKLTNWDYTKLPDEIEGKEMERSKVLMSLDEIKLIKHHNKHALQCLGSKESSDVLAPLIYRDADVQTTQYTWRANKGEDLLIEIANVSSTKSVKRHPKLPTKINAQRKIQNDMTKDDRHFKLSNASLEDNALYQIGHYKTGAYFNIIIRDCESGKYGTECQHQCPKCQNGGQCHSYTGECLCPPGFIGDKCQHACPKHWFGTTCQFKCTKKTLLFDLPEEGTCKGLTICQPNPLGCSCPAGYKGPVCNEVCGNNTYGSGCHEVCSERCDYANCDSFTGSCNGKAGYPSTAMPTNVKATAEGSGELTVTWNDQDFSPNRFYFILYKLMRFKSCPPEKIQGFYEESLKVVPFSDGLLQTVLQKLTTNADYEITVIASDEKNGQSRPTNASVIMPPEPPTLNVSSVSCNANEAQDGIICKATVQGNCLHFNGDNTRLSYEVSSHLACNDTEIKRKHIEKMDPNFMKKSETDFEYSFSDLIGGLTYNVSVTLMNDEGKGMTSMVVPVKLSGKSPPPVKNLTVAIIGERSVRFMWNDPCPSFGEIDKYYVSASLHPSSRGDVSKSDAKCPVNIPFDGCSEIQELTIGSSYGSHCYVIVYNSYGESEYLYHSFTMTEIEPTEPHIGPPSSDRQPKDLKEGVHVFEIFPPINPGGQLVNCTITGLGEPCNRNYDGNKSMICEFDNLDDGKLYKYNGICCNTKYCGKESTEKELATKPNPKFQGDMKVTNIKSSNITLKLPKITNGGDSNSTYYIAVMDVSKGNVDDFKSIAKSLIKEEIKRKNRQRRNVNKQKEGGNTSEDEDEEESVHRMKRDVGLLSKDQNCNKDVWIAGQVNANKVEEEFIIGDGTSSEGFTNCPLEEQKSYAIGILLVSKIGGETKEKWLQLSEPVKVVPMIENPPTLIIIITVVIIIVVGIITIAGVYYRYKHPRKAVTDSDPLKPSNALLPWSHAEGREAGGGRAAAAAAAIGGRDRYPHLAPTVHPARERYPPLPPPVHPAINMESLESRNEMLPPAEYVPNYMNLNEDEPIYGNLNRRIHRPDVESYLNRNINCTEAMEEFSTVPSYMKKMTIGADPIHKKKNRYRNNLPYDETRVILSVVHGDPSTDYINANHIQGYTNTRRYIATQGPKDQLQPTIGDFWRMVVEQKVTAIIMVANFIEGGKSKVGQYLVPGEVVAFQEFTVQVVSSDHQPYFTISTVKVFVNGNLQQELKHYHYTNWPDHGVPEEARSIASLITTFLETNLEGTTVVHCSAGIGRTGTVLMVLLLQEMLSTKDSLDPLEALTRLREGRGRLVENAVQYNLALEIIEEVLFGKDTIIPLSALQGELENLLGQVPSLYSRASTLSSPLTYKYTADPSTSHLNRNPAIIPADSQRIYLGMISGQSESQYVNAVRVRGLMKKEAMIVTEHPVREAVDKFWRLILEKKCSLVILLNEYDPYTQDEFVPLLPENDQEMRVAGYKITIESYEEGRSISQYFIKIMDEYGILNTISVYQVHNWKYGSGIPDDPDVLVNLADVLLQKTSISQADVPLLCCGDGVTACGLVAGITFLLERAQTEQIFDVYRTVVKLRRSREQFITSQEQFGMLFEAAARYINNFSTYANFN